MTAIRCLECRHLDVKERTTHANEGIGRCKIDRKPGEFVSYLFRRTCDSYERVDAATEIELMAWQEQLNMFRKVKEPKCQR